eukprot:TRINITY_DN50826_c0_g1_i1.p4 TRINITY_DN50826_c0_g1~~TRINITY_DN50826_c0_g1_i1.p4  ORF type:complete len:189 (+),score=53.69 TRINITY_DN50826_c0_g1_i1:46-612(+)
MASNSGMGDKASSVNQEPVYHGAVIDMSTAAVLLGQTQQPSTAAVLHQQQVMEDQWPDAGSQVSGRQSGGSVVSGGSAAGTAGSAVSAKEMPPEASPKVSPKYVNKDKPAEQEPKEGIVLPDTHGPLDDHQSGKQCGATSSKGGAKGAKGGKVKSETQSAKGMQEEAANAGTPPGHEMVDGTTGECAA